MSLLFISYEQENKTFTSVSIMRKVAKFLFAEIIEPLSKVVDDKDFLDKAEADLMIENVSLTNLTKDEFTEAYQLIKAKSSDEMLKPYADEILQKMQADPRYTV